MYVVPLTCQALCLAFWLLNVPFQATANSLKKKTLKLTHINWPAAKKTKHKTQKEKQTHRHTKQPSGTKSSKNVIRYRAKHFPQESVGTKNIGVTFTRGPQTHLQMNHNSIKQAIVCVQIYVSMLCLYCPYLYFAFHLFGAEKTQLPANSSQTKVRIVSEWGKSEDIK